MSLRTRMAGGTTGGAGEDPPPSSGAAVEREQFGEALHALADAVIVVDADGVELLRNDAAERFRDGRHSDALAEEQINELLTRARQGQSGERELQLFGPPREVLFLRSQPLLADGAILGAVVFIRDISETRRKEAVRRDFVANVSHELKTPIGALALLAETMAGSGDEVVVRQLAERVSREADRLGRIIDDLLNLSLIEAQESPSREPVPISVLIAEAVDAVRPAADALGIPLHVSPNLPDAAVPCDRRQVLSALTNLLDNAIKYSESPSAVEIGATASDGMVTITVTDHGPGHPVARPRADLRAVLPGRPGPQPGDGRHRPRPVHRPPRRPGARRRRHGRVARGRGLDVPAAARAGRQRRWLARRLPVRRAALMADPQLILVVDDEQSYRDALTVALEREGFAVETAADGVEALERFDAVQPALVLLDVMLPRVSGVDVCRQIRTRSRVPIIMVTARNAEIDAVVGLEVGADDYVTKPFRLRELIARVRAALRRVPVGAESSSGPDDVIEIGDVRLDVARHEVSVRGDLVALPLKEFELLELLLANAGRVLTRDVLIDRIWGPNYFGDTKTLDVHVKRLRTKVEEDPGHPTHIVTVRGVGYRFEKPRVTAS